MTLCCCTCWKFSSKNNNDPDNFDNLTYLRNNNGNNEDDKTTHHENYLTDFNEDDEYENIDLTGEESKNQKLKNEKILCFSIEFFKCNKNLKKRNSDNDVILDENGDKKKSCKNVKRLKDDEFSDNNLNDDKEDFYSSNNGIKKNNNKLNNSNLNSDSEDEGNPRNKCALKPGHSLMDWIRMGSSGVDLAGTKGIITPVNNIELNKHCKEDDAWIAIRGKVYNVTRYMDFHPGGADELMKGVGKDATKLFDEVHAWVNYEQLLAKCYIGPLRNVVQVDLEPIKPRQKATTPTPNSAINNNGDFKSPTLPIRLSNSEKSSPTKPSASQSTDEIILNNDNLTNDEKSNIIKKRPNTLIEIIPRFDWIQKTSELSLIFYTKPFCNPGIHLTNICDNQLDVRILIELTTHLFKFKFNQSIRWPSNNIKISRETGKIEFTCIKIKPELWTAYGAMEREKFFTQHYTEDLIKNENNEYIIEKCMPFNHDSFILILKAKKSDNLLITPIGYHISLTAFIEGEYVTRSYTPVPANYIPFSCSILNVPILIKSYSNGILAKHITNNLINKALTLILSPPKGNFQLIKLLDHNRIGLISAGSGITPILAVLDHLLLRTNNRIEHIELMCFNKTKEDIWCHDKLEMMSAKDSRITFRNILSAANDEWTGEKGHVCDELVTALTDAKSKCFVTFCCVCGPQQFNEVALQLLQNAGFPLDHIHIFQG